MRKRAALVNVLLAAALLAGCGDNGSNGSGSSGTASGNDTVMGDAAALVAHIPTTQSFTDEEIPAGDIESILTAGVNSPSSRNTQPWHFAAVTSKDVLNEISGSMSFGGGFGSTKGDSLPDGVKPPEGENPPEGKKPSALSGTDGGSADGKGKSPQGGAKPSDGEKPSAPSGAGGGSAKASVGDTPLAVIVSCENGSELDAGLATQAMSVEALLLGYSTKIVTSPAIGLNGEKQGYFRELFGVPESQSFCAVLLVGKAEKAADGGADVITSATTRNPMNDMVTYVS